MSLGSSSRVGGSGDVALLCVIGAVLAVGALAWLWGGLAGLVFGAGWPRVSGAQVFGVLLRLPGSLAHPALAWPAAVRSRLPGPLGFYGALALLGAGFVALLLAALRVAHSRPTAAAGAGAHSARGRALVLL